MKCCQDAVDPITAAVERSLRRCWGESLEPRCLGVSKSRLLTQPELGLGDVLLTVEILTTETVTLLRELTQTLRIHATKFLRMLKIQDHLFLKV